MLAFDFTLSGLDFNRCRVVTRVPTTCRPRKRLISSRSNYRPTIQAYRRLIATKNTSRATPMCNRYSPADREAVAALWSLRLDGYPEWALSIGPWQSGPFVRLKAGEPELVVGQWALIGDDDKKANSKPRMTNNARFETIAQLKTFRGPWKRAQRCVIPAESYDEPNWETEKNVWWTLRRADGQPWHLAGLWNAWTDPVTGEVVESYTAITTSADAHPLLRRLHRPDRSRPVDMQDKRAVVPIEVDDLPAWLGGSIEQASALIRLPEPSRYEAGPTRLAEASRLQVTGATAALF